MPTETPPVIPDGSPWWLYLVQIGGWLLVTLGSVWLMQRPLRRTLAGVATDAAATREQAENEHADAEFPNLRDEITEIRVTLTKSVGEIRDDIGGLHSETRDLRKDVTGIRTDARRDRRKLAEQEQALDDHLTDVPRIIDELLDRHVGDCPLRSIPTTTD